MSILKSTINISKHLPKDVKKLAILKRNNKYCLYAIISPINRVLLASFSNYNDAKSTAKTIITLVNIK